MSASDHLNPGQFYHGTVADLSVGDHIETGHATTTSKAQNRVLSNSGQGGRALYNHATNDLMVATAYAQRASTVAHVRTGEERKTPRVYEVEFTGDRETDPDAGERKGNPLGYRSTAPLRILREVEPKYDRG